MGNWDVDKAMQTLVEHGFIDKDGHPINIRMAEIPSVTPKQRSGKWQEVYAETDYRNGWIKFSCENCEYQHGLESGEYGWSYGDPIPWKYCPICGARMVEPQESDHKCHTCKHYTSGDNDGSCGSYICKGYSNWESEEQDG